MKSISKLHFIQFANGLGWRLDFDWRTVFVTVIISLTSGCKKPESAQPDGRANDPPGIEARPVSGLPSPPAHRRAGSALTNGMIDIEYSVDSVLRALDQSDRRGAYQAMLRAVLQMSIGDADEFVRQLPLGRLHTNAIGLLAERFASQGSERALEWLDTLPKAGSSGYAYSRMGKLLAHSDLAEAVAYFDGIDDPLLRQKFGGMMLAQAAADNPAMGLSILEDHAGLFLSKQVAYGDYVGGLREGGHFEVAAEFLRDTDIGDIAETVANKIGRAWQASAGNSALEWLSGNPDQKIAADIARGYVGQMAVNDAAGVSVWLSSLEPSFVRDEAIASFAAKIYRSQPAVALNWVAEISDDDQKMELAKGLMREIIVDSEGAIREARKLGLLP